MTSMVHLVYGPVAAGKSTFASTLAKQRAGVRFALDDWMHTLFGPDQPAPLTLNWAMPRVARCQAMIWTVASEVIASGREVVLELGLLREADRDRMNTVVEAGGHRATFHFVDANRATRARRVAQRNNERGPTWSFDVTPGMFDAIESIFEPPTLHEQHHLRVSGDAEHG